MGHLKFVLSMLLLVSILGILCLLLYAIVAPASNAQSSSSIPSYWRRDSGVLSPTIITDSVSIGSLALSPPLPLSYGGTGAGLTAAANKLVYSGSSTLQLLNTGNNGTLVTSGSGVPSISATLPDAVQSNITAVGTLTDLTMDGNIITSAGTALSASATAPAVGASAQVGAAVSIAASDAVAGNVNNGAAAGGGVTIESGAAKRLNTGLANGGTISIQTGVGVGGGYYGNLNLVTSGGNVGIGVADPGQKLRVQGQYVGYFAQTVSNGQALVAHRNIDETGNFPLVNFVNDHVTNTQTTLRVQQDGTGDILDLVDGAASAVRFVDGGFMIMTGVAFTSLGTPANGTFVYCTDCQAVAVCADSGSGAFAKRLNSAWVCN